ncbi:hypothetical protein D4R78_05825 [bacterium]|nr:MAG: hypothetical protein D4R78_05825 [bacterium]
MEGKKKIIIIGIIGLLVALSLVINLSAYSAKKTLERERAGLQKENSLLARKIAEGEQIVRGLQEKINSLNKDLKNISQGKEEIQSRYSLLEQERAGLIEKLKAKEMEKPPVPEVKIVPQTDDAYWGEILKQKTDLELQLEKVRVELKALQGDNTQLQKDNRNLTYNQQVLDSLAQELVKEKNDRMSARKELESLKKENAMLKKELRVIISRKVKLDEKMDALQKDQAALQDRLAEMEIILKDKTSYVEDLKKQIEAQGQALPVQQKKEAVELPTIVVRPQAGASMQVATQQEFKIIAINRENGFVIIDAGIENGIGQGSVLHVYRDGKPIATLEAIQVRADIAACDIKQEIATIAIGDMVK